MKQLSYSTRTLINRLQTLSVDQKDWLGRLDKTAIEQALVLVKQIAQSGEWLAVIYLVQYLAAKSDEVARSAVDAIELLLQDIAPEHLLQLDDRIRSGGWSVPAHLCLWDDLKFSALQKYLIDDRHIALLGVASFHRSGYERQDAVKELSRINDGKELPYLLIRLSDWVPAVRRTAEIAVQARIKTDYLQHFVDNLALIKRVKERQRCEPESRRLELIESVHALLKEPANFDLLVKNLNHRDLTVRRVCLSLLLEVQEPELAKLVPHIIYNSDAVIRQQAVGLALRLGMAEQQLALERLLQDRAPSIRCEALRGLCTTGGELVAWRLRTALLDPSTKVRQYAVWQLATLEPDFDFRGFYTQCLQDLREPQALAAAVAGLGEIGVPADGQQVLFMLDHPRLIVQRAAIKALSKLDPDHHTASFLRLLKSESASVSRAAQKALDRTKNIVTGSTLWPICQESAYWHVKRNALMLVNQLEKWDRLCYLLLALADNDKQLKTLAISCLPSWQSQYKTTWGFTRPNSRQQELLRSALRDSGDVIPCDLSETLEQCLRAV